MPSDRSRPPDRGSDAYTGTVMQQGRVVLDRDFNALREIIDRRDVRTTRDVVGPCGTPDDGFAISAHLLLGSRAASDFPVVGPPIIFSPATDPFDLLIRSGTMYLGGVRVEWPGNADGTPVNYSYYAQPDWLTPKPPAAPQTEIVWLQADEREVSATEDPDLLDVALGGPDTTQRLRLMRTVHRAAVAATTCSSAWQALLASWQAAGWGYDPATTRLVPQARMQAAFTTPVSTTDPCDPIATGGYLGAENQLIRVKWAPPAAGATAGTLIWSYDDASFIYPVTPDETGTRLTLARNPPDAYHFPGTGQFVEVLRTTALLGHGGAQTAEDGSGLVPRCIAEETGFVTTLSAAYDPTSSDRALVLGTPLPAAYRNDPEPLFVRIWQGGGAMPPAGGTLELIDPVARVSTGITVILTVPGGSAIAPGSFWMMALRPGTPLTMQPAELLTTPQPPDGPRSLACPLAVVEWSADRLEPIIHDCRIHFDNLITLTQRPEGCCTVFLRPTDVTTDRTLQSAIDGMAGPGTLCLAPGTYRLLAPLRIDAKHTRLTIVAENGATLAAASGSEAAFADGLIVVAGAPDVTLRGLTLVPPAVAVPSWLLAGLSNLTRIALGGELQPLARLLTLVAGDAKSLGTAIGVRAAGCRGLTLDQCAVRFARTTDAAIGNVVGIGLLAGGACSGLVVRGCRFDATALAPTQTPGLLQTRGFLGATGFVLEQRESISNMHAIIGCLASPYVAQFLSTPSVPAIARAAQPAAPAQPAAAPAASTTGRSATRRGTRAAARVIAAPAGATATATASVSPAASAIASGAGPAAAAAAGTPDAFTVIADLSGAVFEDNTFNSVTLAISALGMLDRVRIEGNTVLNSSGGFWLRPIDEPRFTFTTGASKDPVVAGDSMWLKFVLMQREAFIAWVLSLVLPLPAGATVPVFAVPTGGTSMRVAGNEVAALAGASTGALAWGMPALAVVNGTYTPGIDVGPSLVVAENRLRSRTAPQYPAVVLAISGRLTTTGNQISNEPAVSPPTSISLEIFPEDNGRRLEGLVPAPLICVTGNVLEGSTNLGLLTRTDTAGFPAPFNSQPFNTWLLYNAVS